MLNPIEAKNLKTKLKSSKVPAKPKSERAARESETVQSDNSVDLPAHKPKKCLVLKQS